MWRLVVSPGSCCNDLSLGTDCFLPSGNSDSQSSVGSSVSLRKLPPESSVSSKIPFKNKGEIDIFIQMKPKRICHLQTPQQIASAQGCLPCREHRVPEGEIGAGRNEQQ